MLRRVTPNDHDAFIALCREFYHSPAVLAPVPDQNIENTFRELCAPQPLAEAYFFIAGKSGDNGGGNSNAGNIAAGNGVAGDSAASGGEIGYCLLASAYSNEAGGKVQWIEELYVRAEYRGRGCAHELFRYLEAHRSPDIRRFRLEVEPDNEAAKRLYRRMGFKPLPYQQLVKDFPPSGE